MSKQSFWTKHPELTRQINMNFVIRVFINIEGEKHRRLVGAGQIEKYLDEQTALKEFQRVLTGTETKYTWWDRKAVRIEFIAK